MTQQPTSNASSSRLRLGVITGAHGVRGYVKIRSFTQDPANIASYGPLYDDEGHKIVILSITSEKGEVIVARVEGVDTRTGAEALRGTQLYIDRHLLPDLGNEEFYHADLIGLLAQDTEGNEVGMVIGVHNYGASDVLEIETRAGKKMSLPFTHEAVPTIDILKGRVTVLKELMI